MVRNDFVMLSVLLSGDTEVGTGLAGNRRPQLSERFGQILAADVAGCLHRAITSSRTK